MVKLINQNKIFRTSYFFLCFIFFFLLQFILHANENSPLPRTIKIAYFDLGNYYKVDESGQVDSFDRAYLKMISEYSVLNFQFVNCDNWNKAINMLENHEIDLVGTMQWSQEREDKYAICDSYYGYAVAELASLKTSPYIFDDYESFNGATVGYIGNYVILGQLQNMMKLNNINLNLISYPTQTALDNAWEKGEIDLIAANAHAIHSDWKVLNKFSFAPFYFASYKENEELTQLISEAIIQINIYHPEFSSQMIKKYFPDLVYSPFNKTEQTLIKKGETYKINYNSSTKPLVWFNKKSKSTKGILVDISTEQVPQHREEFLYCNYTAVENKQ